MPLQQTSGAASYDAFGGGVAVAAKYIEDFFQTWLRTGTGSSTTVTTGLNASINKSLVWTKSRSAATNHKLTDTARGVTKALSSNTTGAEVTDSQGLTAFSSTGYTIGTNTDYNNSGATYVDGQWVATPKFFDVVTYTGDGSGSRSVLHSLGVAPGAVFIKRTDSTSNWLAHHKGDGLSDYSTMRLNQTDANLFNVGSGNFTATDFIAGNWGTLATGVAADNMNVSGATYVAYLFAHNAGGFGLTGTDNVISCGSYTGDSSDNGSKQVNLGFEPQWVLIKSRTDAQNWFVVDNMRGMTANGSCNHLRPNLSGEEQELALIAPTATGFNLRNAAINTSGSTYIYIAIRRGPMKVPTTGTSVYNGIASSGANGTVLSVGFPADADLWASRGTAEKGFTDRLRGFPVTNAGTMPWLVTQSTAAEASYSGSTTVFNVDNTSATIGSYVGGLSGVHYFLRRAPGFFDEVCYTGTGVATTQTHNLGVVPELMLVKRRTNNDGAGFWAVYSAATGATKFLALNATSAENTNSTFWNDTAPTSSVFTVGTITRVNGSGETYVAYLFATCAGVSKVFSYTGNGSSQTINCGFTGGARFVMIKRTDSTGDWYVWDSARGIVANNDPHLSLNSTAAEVTTNDTIDTDSTGFVVNQVAATNVNVSSATYIGLAIA